MLRSPVIGAALLAFAVLGTVAVVVAALYVIVLVGAFARAQPS